MTVEQKIASALEFGATELDLSGMGLTALPENIGQLTNLEVLYLSNNQLASLPDLKGCRIIS